LGLVTNRGDIINYRIVYLRKKGNKASPMARR
jgi:hypothetical protein